MGKEKLRKIAACGMLRFPKHVGMLVVQRVLRTGWVYTFRFMDEGMSGSNTVHYRMKA